MAKARKNNRTHETVKPMLRKCAIRVPSWIKKLTAEEAYIHGFNDKHAQVLIELEEKEKTQTIHMFKFSEEKLEDEPRQLCKKCNLFETDDVTCNHLRSCNRETECEHYRTLRKFEREKNDNEHDNENQGKNQ